MEENNFENNNETVSNTPVEPVAPETPSEPVAPTTPVAPETPAEPVAPAAPSEPVMPVEPSATTQIPVQPQPAPVQPTAPAEPPKKGGINPVFIVIVVILLLLIAGLVVVAVILGLNKNGGSNTTTTTAATTSEMTTSTSRYSVTTEANTTTYSRTTKAPDSPTPTSVDGDTIKIGSFTAKIPYGYSIYSSGTQPVISSKSKRIQIQFGYTSDITFDDVLDNEAQLYSVFQKRGYTVLDAAYGLYNNKKYILFSLSSPTVSSNYGILYGVTEMGSGVLEFQALYDSYSTTSGVVLSDADYVITQAKNSGSSFAPGDIVEAALSPDSIDNLDTRLFE